jgi:hypothetical protein
MPKLLLFLQAPIGHRKIASLLRIGLLGLTFTKPNKMNLILGVASTLQARQRQPTERDIFHSTMMAREAVKLADDAHVVASCAR